MRVESRLEVLAPYKRRLEKVAVESTYNWYWLVDGLSDQEYPVVLANPARIDQYDGLPGSGTREFSLRTRPARLR